MTRADFEAKYGFGKYAVTVVEHFLISMRDGIQLAAKAWFPGSSLPDTWFPGSRVELFYEPEGVSTEERYPVILEYLPYRKSDFTAQRDYRRQPWMASQGYVMLRVDIRGSGESEGLYFDEYLKQEQDDGLDVMKWVSAQTWSTGKVGMMGKSWGGFNGLQMAYCQPPELKAVVSVYSTDDRYATDMHHDGGCVMDGLLSWTSTMLLFNAHCPDPRLVPNWKEMWRDRLDNTQPWSKTWLQRQLYDDYWAHGSVCEDFTRVTCPVLLIGGWRDGYRDAVFRMVDQLPDCKAIIGPWPHDWPDTATPGPNIEYLKVVQQWFDHHLKDIETNVLNEPKMRLYLQSARTPEPSDYQSGRWIQLDGWTSQQVQYQTLKGQGSNLLLSTTDQPSISSWQQVPFSLLVGMNQGLWLHFKPSDGSPDQRLSDAYSLVYTTEVLEEDMALLGPAELQSRVKVTNHNQGMLAARLVDQFPSGECTLVTYGVLNLTHFQGHTADKVRSLVSGKEICVTLPLHATSYVFPKGHRLKLCLSSCYWPVCWPSSKCVDMYVSDTILKLPLLHSPTDYKSDWFNTATSPKVGPAMEIRELEQLDTGIKLEMDFTGKRYKRSVNTGVEMPLTELVELGGMRLGNTVSEIAEVREGDPCSASLQIQEHGIQYYPPGVEEGNTEEVAIEVHTDSVLKADQRKFYLYNKLQTTLNGQVFYEKEWKDDIDRQYV